LSRYSVSARGVALSDARRGTGSDIGFRFECCVRVWCAGRELREQTDTAESISRWTMGFRPSDIALSTLGVFASTV
jgi:hypothetical protein